jgi:hypothetical protein
VKQAFKPKASIYVPVDEILASPRARILRTIRHFDWVSADELFLVLDVPSWCDDAKTYDSYTQQLRLLVTSELIERRELGGSGRRFEYRLAANVDTSVPPPNLDGYVMSNGKTVSMESIIRSRAASMRKRRRARAS